jgi:curved DNA-binding protein CbpA
MGVIAYFKGVKMKIDRNVNYYKILGVDEKATTEEIDTKYSELYSQYLAAINEGSKHNTYNPKDIFWFAAVTNAHEILIDSKARQEYDMLRKKMKENKKKVNEAPKVTEETPKVIKEEDAPKKTISDSNKMLIGLDTAIVACLIITSALYFGNSKKNNNTNNESATMATTEEANVSASEIMASASTSEAPAAAATTEVNADIAGTAWDKISTLQAADPQYASDITENDVKKLVEWAKHEKPVMPNAKAYGMLQELAEDNKYNIAELNTDETKKETVDSFVEAFNDVEENNTLTDEDKCFEDINKVINTLPNDDPTIANQIAAELYAHYAVNPELPEACGDAQTNGQEGKDYQKLINTISAEDIKANNATLNAYYDWVNPVLDISDKEDNTKKLVLTK